jgi:hypothetical protein
VLRDPQLFEKDLPGHHDDADLRNGANTGLYRRSMYTDEDRLLEFGRREAILKGVLTYEYKALPLANSLLWAIDTPALVF